MSPHAITRPDPGFTLTLLDKSAEDKHDFGAVVEGLDLNNITDADVKALADAIWTHKVVVVKGQKDLAPIKQWELVTRFDPEAPQVHSHGDIKSFNKKGGVLSVAREVIGIPGAENVRLIGKGYQGADHYGIQDKTLHKALSHDFHAKPLPDAEFAAGFTRFQRWHMDAPLYGRDPAWFTTLRCCRRPRSVDGKPVTIRWDDGSGLEMESEPGLTAFFSNVQTYGLMTPEEQRMADHSWVEYAPHPYMWIGDCRGRPNGLGLETEGREKAVEELGGFDPAAVKRYPMVWTNPVTGEKAFQVHGICARRLFVRSSPDEQRPRVIDDVAEIRAFLKPIQERVLRPEYILLPSLEEGDIVMWANYQMFHTAVDYPISLGPRTMHQANIGASIGPQGPVPIPAAT
ncbi:dioxygenase [Apiospora marii]|uniref:Dioxygenase n=1 Tax=Apiospora marii TaxID=335849 RepID=A0ABR1R9Q6_9PEZI